MAVETREITLEKYGKCISISNDAAELFVTVDVGPRIIHYALKGKENMLCQQPDLVGDNEWKILGGHRLWHSPEALPRTYEHDDHPVHYTLGENGVRVTQDIEKWAMIEKEMEIVMDDDTPAVSITHRLRNCGAWPVELSAWALTVMAPGGLVVAPMTQRDTGLLSNRTLALWPYSKMNDKRVWWGERYITLRQDAACEGPFKVGINNEYGWAAYFNQGCVFIKQHEHILEETYPDGGMSFETYTNHFMTEIESLSPVTEVEPDDFVEHVELWTLVDGFEAPVNDDDEIDAVIDEIMEACGAYESCDCDDCEGCGCGCGDEDCGCHDDDCECHRA